MSALNLPLPSLFVSHGAPTIALEHGPMQTFWADLGERFAGLEAILCISAHWLTRRPALGAAEWPETIHDFHGFPASLYRLRYPAPGAPALATSIAEHLRGAGFEVETDAARGLDHGAWVPLRFMFPEARVPVIQLSVQMPLGPRHHFELGRALAPLRSAGVLILGSGGATHNLRDFVGQAEDAPVKSYARLFDDWLAERIVAGDTEALLDYARRAPEARHNHPTPDHLLPLFLPLGAGTPGRPGRVLYRGFSHGFLSLAAFEWD
jgi:4,5-DOPA dioxygenase extradiol